MTKITAIVAMAENNCIGLDNKMPWHIPEDLKRFKSLTLNKPIIMGRKTFESILGYLGKPLPKRHSIILTRGIIDRDDIETSSNLSDAIESAKKHLTTEHKEIIIGGGADIYRQALALCTHLELTKIHVPIEGDAFFPEIDTNEWDVLSEDYHDADAENGVPAYSFITLERKVMPSPS